MKVELIKEDSRGKVYQADDFKIFYRNKDTVSGDNSENIKELIYLVTGYANVTLKDFTQIIDAPAKMEFPENTYHKIEAITDIVFILYEK